MFRTPIFLIPLAVGFLLLCTSCSPPTQSKEPVASQKKQEARRQVMEMAARHEADLEWLTVLEGKEFYTIELQQALLKPLGRLRLFIAPVADVLKRDDTYFITAHDWTNDVYFQLDCDAKQAQYVLNSSTKDSRMFEEYAIVMKPRSVHKPVAQLAGEIDVDNAYVVHDAADIVVVKGTCIDILSLKDSRLDIEDLLTPNPDEKR